MGDVIELDIQTKLDIPSEKILQGAISSGITNAVVIGLDADERLYFAASDADVTMVLWLIEKAKQVLLADGDEE